MIRGLIATGATDGGPLVAVAELPEPTAAADEAVVAVEASSVNHGEVEWLTQAAPGWRPGWDVAGRVLRAAQDGSGPPAGTRVAGFLPQAAWAERTLVPGLRLGALPEELPAATAAAIPVAGLTALRALREAGALRAGSRVLVTGAAGAIGRIAVQLAARAGAEVTALVRAGGHAEALTALGAAAVVEGTGALDGSFDAILDGVAGPVLGACLPAVAPGGSVVLYGDASHEPTTFASGELFLTAPGARICALRMDASPPQDGFAADLSELAALVRDGVLDVEAADPVDWREAGDAIAASRSRRPARKPVLVWS
ncbi:MAG TPA: zinc-binding dehydrogenase [Baekduia sp.]|uniref:zinc-binding dehydrogenase n=1 Tax=Baekduia sp. TaxID=2600305 RepID=UPI002C4398FA|nr:zinc-binding dehydrogenase [Baekduia sp.]HMJ37847.1 zinc-binding dehydrogenase [Baekduia sp.]